MFMPDSVADAPYFHRFKQALRELVSAGLVTMRRRGQGRSNVYTLHPENSVKDSETTLPEAQNLRIEGERMNEERGENLDTSIANSSAVLSLEAERLTQEPQIPSPPCSPVSAPLIDEVRAAIFPYVKDIARELHDESSLTATTTRAVRAFQRSGLSIEDFQNHLLSCRKITSIGIFTVCLISPSFVISPPIATPAAVAPPLIPLSSSGSNC